MANVWKLYQQRSISREYHSSKWARARRKTPAVILLSHAISSTEQKSFLTRARKTINRLSVQ